MNQRLQDSPTQLSADLKHLETELKRAEENLRLAKLDQTEAQSRAQAAQVKIADIKSRIDGLKRDARGIIVSEHARLRYIERVMGVDMEEIDRKIVPAAVEAQIKLCGNGKYPVGDSHALRVHNNTVTTVIIRGEE